MFLLILLFLTSSLSISADFYDQQFNQFTKAVEPLTLFNADGTIQQTKDISSGAACEIQNWDNVAQYGCRCSIVQKADKIIEDVVNGTALLNECKKEGTCTDDLINGLRATEGLTGVSDTEFVNALYDRSVVIKEVPVDFDAQLKASGYFTEKSMKDFLVHAYKIGRITNSAFANPDALTVKNLGTGGGTATLQLFLVKDSKTNQEFIVKEVAKAQAESFDLSLASHYKLLQPFTKPSAQGGPVLLLPIAYLKYTAGKKTHYMIIMPKAPGVEFLKPMKDYIADPSDTNKTRLQKAYALLGSSLAVFHKTFMQNAQGALDSTSLLGNTLVHGDFHPKNIFYDEANGQIYWIDLERLGKSVARPRSADTDFGYTTLFPFLADFNISEVKGDDRKKWGIDFFPSFFNAYLDTYGGDKKQHANEIKKLIKNLPEDWSHTLRDYAGEILDGIVIL